MKLLLVLSCLMAACSAAWSPYYSPWAHLQHVPVIGPNGVPLDTPEVQAAKAHHAQAHLEASSRAGYGYGHLYNVPVVGHNALPLDTPEVAAARVQHFHDYAVAAQRNGVHVPLIAHGGVHPVDTPEVQLAKAHHFAAHAEARARTGHHYRRRRSLYNQHIPVIGPNGVPVDTPEVQHARAQHLAALQGAPAQYLHAAPAQYAPVAYSPYAHSYPTLAHDGQPLETPEVQAAKAHHFAAHAEAQARAGPALGHVAGPVGNEYNEYNRYHGPLAQLTIGPGGVPVDTPEVQHARASHLAAHGHGPHY